MARKLLKAGLIGVVLATSLAPATNAWSQGPERQIRVIVDGPWERNDEISAIFRQEILDLVGLDYNVVFVPETYVAGEHTRASVEALVEEALADPEIDLVLTGGPIASNYVARRSDLPKPVVAPFILNAQVQGLPYDEGTSGVPNLNYITFTGNFADAINVFREVAPFDRLTFLVNEGMAETIPEVSRSLLPLAASLGVEADIIAAGRTAESALEQLSPDTQAVVVNPMNQMAPGEFQMLAEGLIDRRLPSFAVWGRDDVERGLLCTTYRSADFPRLGRRMALNIQRIFDGEDAGDMPVDFARRTALAINLETASAIGISPSWAIVTEAEIVAAPQRTEEQGLTMRQAVERAVEANLDLLAESYRVAAAQEGLGEARAPLLPQIDLGLSARVIDVDRARAGMGGSPQYQVAAQATLQQIIYADGAWANYEINEQLVLSDEQVRDQLRLDIVSATAQAYLDVLRALSFERISQENLALTRTNLELARVREQIGVSGPADVYRFESELATNRQEVIDANTQRNLAEMQLNRLMSQPAEAAFTIVDAEMYGADLSTAAPYLSAYLDSPADFRVFREFMVEEALANSPELAQIDAVMVAQERSLEFADRSFFVPDVLFEGDLTYAYGFGEGDEAGFDLPPDLGFDLEIEEPDDISWTLRLLLSLPLYTGGERQARRSRVDEELAQLTTQRAAVAERIEQSVRSALHQAGASYAGIQLAEDAAQAAQSNLELVQDAYARGAASIPQLLDAQNAARVSSEVAANAVYDYLLDHVSVQRAAGGFDMFRSEEDYAAFLERLDAYFETHGLDPAQGSSVAPGEAQE